MGQISYPMPSKLIFSIISNKESLFLESKDFLERTFGKIDLESDYQPFDFTDYYKNEMGVFLKQKIISFEKLIQPNSLSKIKNISNKMELQIIQGGGVDNSILTNRKVNLDPGYITLSKFILASTKDGSARIYMDRGIFAEITLTFTKKSFKPLEWTYQNYQTELFINFLNSVREKYKNQIKLLHNST